MELEGKLTLPWWGWHVKYQYQEKILSIKKLKGTGKREGNAKRPDEVFCDGEHFLCSRCQINLI